MLSGDEEGDEVVKVNSGMTYSKEEGVSERLMRKGSGCQKRRPIQW
jgi:hypothetical protein